MRGLPRPLPCHGRAPCAVTVHTRGLLGCLAATSARSQVRCCQRHGDGLVLAVRFPRQQARRDRPAHAGRAALHGRLQRERGSVRSLAGAEAPLCQLHELAVRGGGAGVGERRASVARHAKPGRASQTRAPAVLFLRGGLTVAAGVAAWRRGGVCLAEQARRTATTAGNGSALSTAGSPRPAPRSQRWPPPQPPRARRRAPPAARASGGSSAKPNPTPALRPPPPPRPASCLARRRRVPKTATAVRWGPRCAPGWRAAPKRSVP